MKDLWTDPSLRELLALAALAVGGGCLALAQDDSLFAIIFAVASATVVAEVLGRISST
jgi:hypothetical protein